MAKTLRFLLGDQLNIQHTWFQEQQNDVEYVLMEVRQETDYVRHHIQKIVAFFASMRAFAEKLRQEGHQVIYWQLEHPEQKGSLIENLQHLIQKESFNKFEYQLPDEYRLDEQMRAFCENLSIEWQVFDTEHFLTERHFLQHFFKNKKTYLMESFYRQLRKKYDILMEDSKPLSGKWNYDAENRKKYKGEVPIPTTLDFRKEVSDIVQLLKNQEVQTIGQIDLENFNWVTSRKEALQLLDFFVENNLSYFGTYQDAMLQEEPFLFHSRLSFALNIKLISPLEVIQKSVAHWEQNQEKISLAQIEGFVRQILGWREYMRGVYWAKMPEFAQKNYFELENPLPEFYWTGNTKMNCLSQAIKQSLNTAYAHHIQRLMITGNFALLAGIHPDFVDEWYLGIYIDAIEWVEITNTRGMSQFADGGIVGTKPYVSSANYIDKMSNYCAHCFYDKKKKYGEKACPFNSLYWNFYEVHREKLSKNPRIGMAYRMLDKMEADEKQKILNQASHYLADINAL